MYISCTPAALQVGGNISNVFVAAVMQTIIKQSKTTNVKVVTYFQQSKAALIYTRVAWLRVSKS